MTGTGIVAQQNCWGMPRSNPCRCLPSDHLVLSNQDVHVLSASFAQLVPRVHQMTRILSAAERARASRYYFIRDQYQFIIGRGILRTILGRYLDIDPSQLQFDYGPHGKPYLSARFGVHSQAIHFNVSHSNEFVLLAFTRGRNIGVDMEQIRSVPDMEQIATRFLSGHERAILGRLSGRQELEAFFNCWTRKEAYVKAIGIGLAWPLELVEVSFLPGEPARLLSIAGTTGRIVQWSLQALMPAPNYVAAVAVEASDLHLWYHEYQ